MTILALPPMTLSTFADRDPVEQAVIGFLLRCKNPRTLREYQIDMKLFLGWLASEELHALRVGTPHLTAYLRWLETRISPKTGKRLSEATVGRRFGTVCVFYKYAADQELIDRDPTRGIDRPTIDKEKQKRTYLNVVQWAQLLRASREHSPTAHCLVALLGMKGLRVHEACLLDIETHLYVEDGYDMLRFVGKGSKAAHITLPPPVSRALRECVGTRTSGPLLLNNWGKRMDRASANRLLQRVALEGAVVAEFSPHSLRRTMITTGIAQGVPIADMALIARHSSTATTQLYDMNRKQVDRNSGSQVAAFMSQIAG